MLEPAHILSRLKKADSFSYSVQGGNDRILTKYLTISAIDLRLGRICTARRDITESVEADTVGVRAIESNTGTGNDANGCQVMERIRPAKFILGAYRHPYDEEEMFDISKLTDQEVLQLAERMQAALAKRPISAAL